MTNARGTTDRPAPDPAPEPDPDSAAASMFIRDRASAELGIELVEAASGRAVVSMTVTDTMVNGLGVCHGGLVFTLADTAMAVASNSGGGRTLASGAAIDFLAPSHTGDVLTATCIVVAKPGRNAVNDAVVVNQRGETIAMFRGRTLTLGGS